MQGFFDPCVDDVVELIADQVDQAEEAGRWVKNIVMIGGFAESRYLEAEIDKSMNLRGIRLRRPPTSWTAVVRGAVISGIENPQSAILTKSCPTSYGICLNEQYTATKNFYKDEFVNPYTRQRMAAGQMTWLVQKGDLILANQNRVGERLFTHTFWEGDDGTKLTVPVYTYERDDSLPQRFAPVAKELTTVLTLNLQQGAVPHEHLQAWSDESGRKYWDMRACCRLEYTFDDVLEASLVVVGNTVAFAKLPER